eukprot:scaffold241310_cov31-Tisochrysis_lutea.AAC.1
MTERRAASLSEILRLVLLNHRSKRPRRVRAILAATFFFKKTRIAWRSSASASNAHARSSRTRRALA